MIIVNVMLLVLVFVAIVVYIVEVAAIIRSEHRMHREMRERIEKMKGEQIGDSDELVPHRDARLRADAVRDRDGQRHGLRVGRDAEEEG